MELLNNQIFILVSIVFLYFTYLSLSSQKALAVKKQNKFMFFYPYKNSLKNFFKSMSSKINVDLITLLKIYLIGVVINLFIFEVYDLGSEELMLDQYTLFMALALFTVIIKVENLSDISLFKKSVQLVSELIFVLLLVTQYYIWIKVISIYIINPIFFALFFIHFIFSYITQANSSKGNLFYKTLDFEIKILWLILMLLIFLGDFRFVEYNRKIEFLFCGFLFLKFFNALEQVGGKIVFRQSMDLYRKFYMTSIIALAIGSIFVGIFI